MRGFSISEVALTGFRLSREQPKVIVIWSLVYVVFQVIVAVCTVTLGGDAMAELLAASQTPNPDPATLMALYARILPLYGVLMLIMIPFYMMMMTAGYRAVLRPEDARFGYLRFSADEARQFVVILVLGILMFLLYIVAVIVTVVVTAGVGAGLVAAGVPAVVGSLVGVLIAVPLFLAIFAPPAVRLSLAGPQTLAERQIKLFDSWALTKGHFWSMLGAYLISTLLMIVVTLLGLVIAFGFAAALGGGMDGLRSVMSPDTSSIAAYFSPLMIVYLVVMSVISAMGLAITLTPSAAIYRAIASPSARDLAETFSD